MKLSALAVRCGLAAGLLALLSGVAAGPARAADGSSSVTCSTGDSCEIMLEHMVQFGGANYSPGADNMVVNIPPPPCNWDPVGNAVTGSHYVLNQYTDGAPTAGDPYDQLASYNEAKQLLATSPPPAGEWYWLPVNPNDTPAQVAACDAEPLYFFARPGEALPGIPIPASTLAQLALTKLFVPGAGKVILSPASGVSYANLPTFVRVTLTGRFETTAGGMPYATDNARLGNQAATVWLVPEPLQLATDDSAVTPDTAGCGYLGSREMVTDPAAVAHTGANGQADCGMTFRNAGNWQITATLTWRACWAAGAGGGPPPAACQAVAGAQLNPDVWNRGVAVREIQAANGSN